MAPRMAELSSRELYQLRSFQCSVQTSVAVPNQAAPVPPFWHVAQPLAIVSLLRKIPIDLSAAQRPFVGIHPCGPWGGGDAPVPDLIPDKLGPRGAQRPDLADALSLGTPPWCPLSPAGSVKMPAFGAYHLCTDNTLDTSVEWRPCPP